MRTATIVAMTALVAVAAAGPVAAQKTQGQAGKACKAGQVDTQVIGKNNQLLTCVKKDGKYVLVASVAAAPSTLAANSTTSPPTTVAAPSSAPVAKVPDKLVFAPVPSENATAALASWSPFVKGLEKELGVRIEQVATSDYAGVIEAQLSGKVDIAMYGPFSYYLAKKSGANIEPVAVLVPQIGGPASYQSYLVAKAGSPINGINDVKGKKVCFVDTASTSGYLYPYAGLKEAGIDFEKDITAVYAGGHDKSVAAVKAGTCDAGFAYDDMVDKLAIDRGLIKAGELKTVWKSKPIPLSPIAIRSDLPEAFKAKLKAAILNVDTLYVQSNKLCPSDKPNCDVGGGNAWSAVKDDFFKPIDDVCKLSDAPACKPAKK